MAIAPPVICDKGPHVLFAQVAASSRPRSDRRLPYGLSAHQSQQIQHNLQRLLSGLQNEYVVLNAVASAIKQFWTIDKGVMVQPAQTGEFCMLKARYHLKNTNLFGVFHFCSKPTILNKVPNLLSWRSCTTA